MMQGSWPRSVTRHVFGPCAVSPIIHGSCGGWASLVMARRLTISAFGRTGWHRETIRVSLSQIFDSADEELAGLDRRRIDSESPQDDRWLWHCAGRIVGGVDLSLFEVAHGVGIHAQ